MIERFNDIKSKIPGHVKIIVVTKTIPANIIIEFINLTGHCYFAENYVQEASEKWTAIRAKFPNVQLNLIGHLQSNKVKDACGLFDVIQTIDSTRLIDKIALQTNNPALYVQLNTSREKQKSGITPEDLDSFMSCKVAIDRITGIMCIPSADVDPMHEFKTTKQLAQRYNLRNISMGMSLDYLKAIEYGATEVRIGSAIFSRKK